MKNKGMSLLELILVISIAAVIILCSMQLYHKYQRIRDINILESSVNQLMDALNNYYYITCPRGNIIINKDIKKQLLEMGLLNIRHIQNPWGGIDNLSAEIVEDNNLFYTLKVTATIMTQNNNDDYSTAVAGFLRNALEGDMLSGNQNKNSVSWTRLPSYSRDSLNSQEWIFKTRPVSFTSINEGLNSSLWVLNRNLQEFTRKNENQNNQPICPN